MPAREVNGSGSRAPKALQLDCAGNSTVIRELGIKLPRMDKKREAAYLTESDTYSVE